MPGKTLKGKDAEIYVDRLIRETSAVYDAAYEEMRTRFHTASTAAGRFRAGSLLSQNEAIRKALDRTAKSLADKSIPLMYRRGVDISAAAVANMGYDIRKSSFGGRISTAAVQALTDSMTLDLLTANQQIEGTFSKAIRATQQIVASERSISGALARGIATGDTRRAVSSRLERSLAEAVGEGKLIQAGSRRFTPKYYAGLVARTRTREAVTEGGINSATEVGFDLFQVSVHDGACDICKKYQGKVYSIAGEDPDFPVVEARTPFHPHCKHVMVPVTREHLARIGQLEQTREHSNDKGSQVADGQEWRKRLKESGPPRPPKAMLTNSTRKEFDTWLRTNRITGKAAESLRLEHELLSSRVIQRATPTKRKPKPKREPKPKAPVVDPFDMSGISSAKEWREEFVKRAKPEIDKLGLPGKLDRLSDLKREVSRTVRLLSPAKDAFEKALKALNIEEARRLHGVYVARHEAYVTASRAAEKFENALREEKRQVLFKFLREKDNLSSSMESIHGLKEYQGVAKDVISWVPANKLTETERSNLLTLSIRRVPGGDGGGGSYKNTTKRISMNMIGRGASEPIANIDEAKTFAHEFGHHISYQMDGILSADRAFFAKRTAGESLVQLRHESGALFDRSVKGKKDNFDNWREYGGRIYSWDNGVGGTEIASVGAETIWYDPLDAAKTDPEWFELMIRTFKKIGE